MLCRSTQLGRGIQKHFRRAEPAGGEGLGRKQEEKSSFRRETKGLIQTGCVGPKYRVPLN
jgi:hypothetical protein